MRHRFELSSAQVRLILDIHYEGPASPAFTPELVQLFQWQLIAKSGFQVVLTGLGRLVARQLVNRVHLVGLPTHPEAVCPN